MTTVTKQLRQRAKDAGLSSYELARRTKISQPGIIRIFKGKHSPTLDTLNRIASAIGCKITIQ